MAGLTPLEKTMIQEIYKGYQEQKPYIDGLNIVVLGSEKLKIKGLIHHIEDHKEAIKQYKNDRIIVLGVSGILAAIGAWLAKLFN